MSTVLGRRPAVPRARSRMLRHCRHVLLALSLLCAGAVATAAAPEAPVRDRTSSQLAKRLFPALSSLDRSALPAAGAAVLAERSRRMADCGEQAACVLQAAHWSDAQIGQLQPTAPSAAPAGARAALQRELHGVNAILDIYGAGAPPRYPEIDGPRGTPGSERLQQDVSIALHMSRIADDTPAAALDPSIALAIALLDVNDRLDAIAFEPIDAGLNAAAFAAAAQLDWQRHPYTAIIVLGAGPEDALSLSASAKLRIKAAAAAYFSGKAPLLIVSGGAAHPRGTRLVEAVQMRSALIERFGVPAQAVVIEPYARHTTTNLRNAARLLSALHAPAQRSALLVSSPGHLDYVAGTDFAARSQRELGAEPGTFGERVSPFELAFRPAAAPALTVDPADPLDP